MKIRVISTLVSLVMSFLAVNIAFGEIADVTVVEDAADSVVNLFAAFADGEDLDPALTYTITNNTNPGLFTATTINGTAGTLTLDYAADQNGAADITVRAADTGGQFVETTFTVTVNPQNNAPTTVGIADVTVAEDAADSVVNLFAAFADGEDLDPALTYTITNNTNPGLFTATTINGTAGTLTLDYAADQNGAADITVRAADTGGQFVETTFTVTVNPPNITTQEMLRRADEARGNLEGVKWELDIHSLANKRQKKRAMDVKARGYDFLSISTYPPRIKGQKLLMVDHNMWFAKPGVRKPVPVSPRQKLTGEASNGDIAAANYANDYDSTLIGDEIVDGETCYVLDLKAINKKATYDHIKYWISKQRLVGVKAEFYTVSGKLFKWARFEYENRVTIKNKPHLFISKMIITDALISENVTTMEIRNPVLGELPDSIFNLNFLMQR